MGLALPRTLVLDHDVTTGRYQHTHQVDHRRFETGRACVQTCSIRELHRRIKPHLEPRHHAAPAAAHDAHHQRRSRRLAAAATNCDRKIVPARTRPHRLQIRHHQAVRAAVAPAQFGAVDLIGNALRCRFARSHCRLLLPLERRVRRAPLSAAPRPVDFPDHSLEDS